MKLHHFASSLSPPLLHPGLPPRLPSFLKLLDPAHPQFEISFEKRLKTVLFYSNDSRCRPLSLNQTKSHPCPAEIENAQTRAQTLAVALFSHAAGADGSCVHTCRRMARTACDGKPDLCSLGSLSSSISAASLSSTITSSSSSPRLPDKEQMDLIIEHNPKFRLDRIDVKRGDAIDHIKFTYDDGTTWCNGHDGGKADVGPVG
jgi:hypothetical protein